MARGFRNSYAIICEIRAEKPVLNSERNAPVQRRQNAVCCKRLLDRRFINRR